MKRKTFIQRAVGTLLVAIPVYSLSSCSGSDYNDGNPNPDPNPNPDSQANCLENGTKTAISANHGHTLTVKKADVMQGLEKTYSIAGSATHSHNVTLTANDVMTASDDATLTIVGDGGDSVAAGSGWTDGGIVSGFHVYTQGGATLLLDQDLSVNPDIAAA